MRYLLSILLGLTLTWGTMAEDVDVNLDDIPAEVQDVVENEAKKLGHDLKNKKGRRAFGRHLAKEREKKAKELGFDLKTPEGRQAFHRFMKDEMKKAREAAGANMDTALGREKAFKKMAERGQMGLMPMEKVDFKEMKWKPAPPPMDVRKMPKEFRGVMAEQAAELGIDISSKEGRQELANHFEKERHDRAKKMGLDLGKKGDLRKFRRAMDKEMKKMASKKNYDMQNEKHREKLLREMAGSNQLGLMPMDQKDRKEMGWKAPRGPRDKKDQALHRGDHKAKGERGPGSAHKHSHRSQKHKRHNH